MNLMIITLAFIMYLSSVAVSVSVSWTVNTESFDIHYIYDDDVGCGCTASDPRTKPIHWNVSFYVMHHLLSCIRYQFIDIDVLVQDTQTHDKINRIRMKWESETASLK